MDIYELLKRDHEAVSELFDQLEQTDEDEADERERLFDEINRELTVHGEIEETIFYPAIKNADKAHDVVMEGIEEHQIIKQLMSEMQDLGTEDDQWEAKLTVLREIVEHHVDEEETEMFPKARKVLDGDEAEALAERVEDEKHLLLERYSERVD
ncbi:MAG: hemerythrin domain-containing protein [Pseudomonadota bacterium]|nr:hemerythrin domain-containing protein [Pseudomonadota bacterium]